MLQTSLGSQDDTAQGLVSVVKASLFPSLISWDRKVTPRQHSTRIGWASTRWQALLESFEHEHRMILPPWRDLSRAWTSKVNGPLNPLHPRPQQLLPIANRVESDGGRGEPCYHVAILQARSSPGQHLCHFSLHPQWDHKCTWILQTLSLLPDRSNPVPPDLSHPGPAVVALE